MIKLILAALFWLIWGGCENRVWKEHGEAWILGHFKTYHVVMGMFDFAVAALGAGDVWQFLFLLVWAPLSLDIVWWLIRWFDFKRDSAGAAKSYGENNSWHSRSDWDNWLGLPLILGCYWWWWVFGFLCVVLGVLML